MSGGTQSPGNGGHPEIRAGGGCRESLEWRGGEGGAQGVYGRLWAARSPRGCDGLGLEKEGSGRSPHAQKASSQITAQATPKGQGVTPASGPSPPHTDTLTAPERCSSSAPLPPRPSPPSANSRGVCGWGGARSAAGGRSPPIPGQAEARYSWVVSLSISFPRGFPVTFAAPGIARVCTGKPGRGAAGERGWRGLRGAGAGAGDCPAPSSPGGITGQGQWLWGGVWGRGGTRPGSALHTAQPGC